MDVVHKSGADGADTETEGDGRDVPPRADPFAGHVGRNFEDDVGDIEDGENLIVVVAFQAKILLETSQLGVTCNRL